MSREQQVVRPARGIEHGLRIVHHDPELVLCAKSAMLRPSAVSDLLKRDHRYREDCLCLHCESHRQDIVDLETDLVAMAMLDAKLRSQTAARRQRTEEVLNTDDIGRELMDLISRLEEERDGMAHLTQFGVESAYAQDIGAARMALELWLVQKKQLDRQIEELRREQLCAVAKTIERLHPGNTVSSVLKSGEASKLRSI